MMVLVPELKAVYLPRRPNSPTRVPLEGMALSRCGDILASSQPRPLE